MGVLKKLLTSFLSLKKPQMPGTYFGFPVAKKLDDAPISSDLGQSIKHQNKGLALLIAIMIVSVIMVTAAELILTSQVNLHLVEQQKNRLKGEFLAKSGAQMAVLALVIDYGIDLYLKKQNEAQGAKGQQRTDGLGDIWNLFNGLEIGDDTEKKLGALQGKGGLNKVMDSGILEPLKNFPGHFAFEIGDEGSKINLNYCTKSKCEEITTMIEALLSCPVEKAFLEKKRIVPRELAAKIKDFIDSNNEPTPASGLSDEDTPYRKFDPPYRAKNAPFNSLDELKLVDGWDEEMHAVFAPYLTIFPYMKGDTEKSKININTAKREMLACLVPEGAVQCGQKFTLAMQKRDKEGTNLSDKGDIKQLLESLLCYQKDAENKDKNKENWFSTSSDVFKIKVSGVAEDEERTLELVIQRKIPEKDEKKADGDADSAYRLLYWHLI